MNDFNKNMRDILENPPNLQPSAKKMEQMRQKIRAANAPAVAAVPTRGFAWWFVPIALCSAILGGGLVYWLMPKYDGQQIETLKQEVAALQESRPDTVFVNNTIYRIDTISKTIYQKEYIERVANNDNVTFKDFLSLKNGLTNTTNSTLRLHELDAFSRWSERLSGRGYTPLFGKPTGGILSNYQDTDSDKYGLNLAEKETTLGANLMDNKLSTLDEIPLLTLEDIASMNKMRFGFDDLAMYTSNTPLPTKLKKSRKYINPLAYFVPTGGQIGLKIGNIGLLNVPNGSSRNLLLGMSGELQFSKNLRLIGGLEKIGVSYVVTNSSFFGDYPTIHPDDPNDQLHEIYVDLDYLQVPIGLKYIFRTDKKMRPYMSMSLVARQAKRQHLTYEYISMFQEYYVARTFKSSPFTQQAWRAGVGFEYDLGKGFNLNVEGMYNRDYDLNVYEFVKLNHWGVQVGVNYFLGKK